MGWICRELITKRKRNLLYTMPWSISDEIGLLVYQDTVTLQLLVASEMAKILFQTLAPPCSVQINIYNYIYACNTYTYRWRLQWNLIKSTQSLQIFLYISCFKSICSGWCITLINRGINMIIIMDTSNLLVLERFMCYNTPMIFLIKVWLKTWVLIIVSPIFDWLKQENGRFIYTHI